MRFLGELGPISAIARADEVRGVDIVGSNKGIVTGAGITSRPSERI